MTLVYKIYSMIFADIGTIKTRLDCVGELLEKEVSV